MTKPRKNKTNFDYVCLMSVMRVSFCVRYVCVLVDAYVCITHHQTNTYTPKTPKRPNNQPTNYTRYPVEFPKNPQKFVCFSTSVVNDETPSGINRNQNNGGKSSVAAAWDLAITPLDSSVAEECPSSS